LSAFARQKVTVILSGDGADELLAGYETYRADALTPMIRALPTSIRNSLRSLIGYLPAGNKRYSNRMVAERLLDSAEAGPRRDHATFRRIFSDEVKRRLYCPDFLEAVAANDPVGEYAALMAQVPAGRSYLTACQHADLLFHLPAILAKVDRMSMAHALEVRVPLLSRQMVEFCLNLDDAAKRTMMGGKKILRRAFGNDIPPSALQRPKAGFLPPVDKWFSTPGPISTIFGDYLVTARNSLHTLRWDEVERYWQEHRQGRVMGGFALLSILQYINWSMKCRN
jgi:asparagine synthase (glutamine-hydrolysing)